MSIEMIQFKDHQIQIERRPHRRSITIYLAPKKPIIVRAGLRTPELFILSFLESKQVWIEKNLQKFKEIENKFPEKKIKETENFPFRGVDYSLKVVITPGKKYFVSLAEKNIFLHIPINEWHALSKKLEYENQIYVLRDFYKREAIPFLTERIKFWSDQMKLFPNQLKFREQKKRWGSCSGAKTINLNWKLIIFPDEVIDYVIIHELSHLKHLNHSRNFWNLVQTFCPDYKESSNLLKKNQAMTEFLELK